MITLDTIKGAHSGPYVVILGSVHGNERVGAMVVDALSEILKSEQSVKKMHGMLDLIVGNPRAYAANTRFIDYDLNRLFIEDRVDDAPTSSYEVQRAEELKPYLRKADYLLDIHSTIKPSVPFVYTEDTPRHMELAKLFCTQYIVSAEKTFRPRELVSSADTFVDSYGGIGLTYESGWHKDISKFEHVLERTHNFLSAIGVIGNRSKNANNGDNNHKLHNSKSFPHVRTIPRL